MLANNTSRLSIQVKLGNHKIIGNILHCYDSESKQLSLRLTMPASVVAMVSSTSGYRRRDIAISRNSSISASVQSVLSPVIHHSLGYQSQNIHTYLGEVNFFFWAQNTGYCPRHNKKKLFTTSQMILLAKIEQQFTSKIRQSSSVNYVYGQ